MIAAIKDITIWQGIDPRSYVMVSGGGACGLHAIPLAEGLEMKRLLIPRTAGGLSAVGGIFSDIISEYNGSLYTETRNFNFDGVNKLIKELYNSVVEFFKRNNISEEYQKIELYMEGRYPFQVWELPVNITEFLSKDFTINENTIKKMEEAFHKEHERTFSIKEDTYLECVFWKIKAIGKREKEAEIQEEEYHEENVVNFPEKRTGSRKIYFKKYGEPVVTPVYSGTNLVYGDVVQGPAIIEEPTTTIVVLPNYEAKVTKHNNYYIESNK